uniref:Uncharacterized protein n=1 Tax=Arundo donax TaxID=35708 RepID=A0A0A9C097_ARUDO
MCRWGQWWLWMQRVFRPSASSGSEAGGGVEGAQVEIMRQASR